MENMSTKELQARLSKVGKLLFDDMFSMGGASSEQVKGWELEKAAIIDILRDRGASLYSKPEHRG